MTGVISRDAAARSFECIPTYVPRVNEDGNEPSGVPSVLHQAPLGTYLGWNLTAAGFFAGRGCGFVGSYVPFAKTRAERERTGDPRLSVEERYGTLEGYVCGVERAAKQAVADRFLLPAGRRSPDGRGAAQRRASGRVRERRGQSRDRAAALQRRTVM